jgi:hypothetical protein
MPSIISEHQVHAAPYLALAAITGYKLPDASSRCRRNFNNGEMAAQKRSTSQGWGKFYSLMAAAMAQVR